MHAIIKSGGKQFCVNPDDIIKVEKLDLKVGDSLEIDQVLLVKNGDKITTGKPFVSGASVKAEVLEQKRSSSITVFKKKRRQNYRRKLGHRQPETVLKVLDILVDKTSIIQINKVTKKSKDSKKEANKVSIQETNKE